MALAACASPLVGFLAEHLFGFRGAASAGAAGQIPDPEEDVNKAKALGNALLVCLVVPWTICLIVYTGQLHELLSMPPALAVQNMHSLLLQSGTRILPPVASCT